MIHLACLQRKKHTFLLCLFLFSENSLEVAVSLVESFDSEAVKAICITAKFLCTIFTS